MEMPKPGPVHEQLEAFAGTWKGEERMHPSQWDPQGGTAQVSHANRVACDGFWVVGDYEQVRGGAVVFRGHSVLGYDDKKKEVVLHWFDSMGMGPDEFRGVFQGRKLVLTCRNPMGTHRLSYDLGEKGTLRSKMETST